MPISSGSDPNPLPPELLHLCARGAFHKSYAPGCMRKSCRLFVVSLGVDCTAERKALQLWLLPELTKIMEENGVEFDLVDPFFCCPDNFCCDSLFRELCLWDMGTCIQWTTVGVHALVLLNSKYGALMAPPSLSKDQIATFVALAQDPAVVPPAPPSSHPAPLTPAQCARLIRSWYSTPLPDSPEAFALVPTSSRFPLYGTLDLDQKAAMLAWAAAELQLTAAFESCGVACPSLLERLVDMATTSCARGDSPKRVPVCSVKRLLRCLTRHDPSAPSYMNVERGSMAVLADLDRRLQRLVDKTDATLAPGMQKQHTVVWGDVGITSSTHSEYLRDLVSDVYSLVVDAVSATADAKPTPPPVLLDVLSQSQLAAAASASVYIPGPPLHQLLEYLLDHEQHRPSSKPVVRNARAIVGISGSGRSTCVAVALALIARHIPWSSLPKLEVQPPPDSSPVASGDSVIVYRSIRHSMGTRTPRALLLSIIQQICAAYSALPPSSDTPFMALVNDFESYLSMATAARPLFVALVGIDDLQAIDVFSKALVVPLQLPPYVKFVVTLKSVDDSTSELHDYLFAPPDMRMPRHAAIHMKPLAAELQQPLLRAQLEAAGVAVSVQQLIELRDALQEVPTPLYAFLTANCSAIRGSSAPVMRFSRSVTAVVDSFFERLPSMGLPDRFIGEIVGLLSACPCGLTEVELCDIISCNDRILGEFFKQSLPPIRRCPRIVVSKFIYCCAPLLQQLEQDGTRVWAMRHPDIALACANRFHADTGLVPFCCNIAAYFQGELRAKYEDRNLKPQPWVYSPPARAVLPNVRKLRLLPMMALMSGSLELIEDVLCKGDFVPMALQYGQSSMDVFDYFSLAMKLLLQPSVSAAARNSYAARFQKRIKEFEGQLAGGVAFGSSEVPLEERLYEWEIEHMHERCQRVERDMLQKWRGDGSSALPFVLKFPDLHALRQRREKYLQTLIPKRWMPRSSVPAERLEQQKSRALEKYFTDSHKMQAVLMEYVGQRLAQQMAVQAVLLLSRQVAIFSQLPISHTPLLVTNGLDGRNMQIVSLEIEKLARMYTIISALGAGDGHSIGLSQVQVFLMGALLRSRTLGALSSRAIRQVVREVEFAEVAIRDSAAISCQLVRDIWDQTTSKILHSDESHAVQEFLSRAVRRQYCHLQSHLSSCVHVVRVIPTQIPCTEEDLDVVSESIALEFGISVAVRDFDGFPFTSAVEGVIQRFYGVFTVSVLDESSMTNTILPANPALRLHKLPLVQLRAKADLVCSLSRHGLEQKLLLSHGSAKVDKSIDAYALLVKGANLVDFIVETTQIVKNNVTATDKIMMDFSRSRGTEDKKISCQSIPGHKLHASFSLHLLAIRRARAQILGFKSACCALEYSMLDRLLLFRRLSTVVSVFVKDNQAFEPLDHSSLSVNSDMMFSFHVDPLTGVMSVSNGRHAVVFSDSLKQLDETDALLVNICQNSCANQNSHALSRLHVMHDVWCLQAAYEEARFTLLRSMHELMMRCSTMVSVEQTARGMSNLLATQSHWDLSCDDQSYASLSVILQAQTMIMRSQVIDRCLVAQVAVERSLCDELGSVMGVRSDDLSPEVYLQRMCGSRLSGDAGNNRSCTLSPGNMGAGDVGSGNSACRVFQLFAVLDDAVDCACDLRHITSSCMQFAIAMEASRFALDAIRRVHLAHGLQQLPTLQHASVSTCNVPTLELCDNPALISYVCKTSGCTGSDGVVSAIAAGLESLRLRESLLDASYRSAVLSRTLKTLLDSSGVAEAIKAEKSGFSTKTRKEREPPSIKAPTIDLAVTCAPPVALRSNPLCSKLVGVSFESLDGLREVVSEKGDNQCAETLRVAIIYELSEAYVLEALVSHTQLAIDVAWRDIACKEILSKSKASSVAIGINEMKLPCNWAGGGLFGALPSDASIAAVTALYSRERILFNALSTSSFEAPSSHEQAVLALRSFCSTLVAEAELPLLIAQSALQSNRLAMKLACLPPKCSPIVATFVEPRIKSASPLMAQVSDDRRAFSSQGDLVDIFILPSIFQWLKPVCNSAAVLNNYLRALMTLSDLLSLVHVRGVIVSENSVGDAMVGFFHKIVTEMSERMNKSTSAEMAHVLQVRCHSWFLKHTILLKAARIVMLQSEDYKNARRMLTALALIENGNGVMGDGDVTSDDGGSQAVVEHMFSRASLGFLDEEFVLTPFAERGMLGNEYSKIDFATTAHLTTLVKSSNIAEVAAQEFDHLRMQLSAVDVRDGLVSLKSGRPFSETMQQHQDSTEIIEIYVRQQLGVPMANLGPEDFVVKLVSRTNVLLLRKYLLEIGAIHDKVSQFEAAVQATSKIDTQDGAEKASDLQLACAALLSCLSRDGGDGDAAPGTRAVLASQLNSVLSDFAALLFQQSRMPGGDAVFAQLSETRQSIEKLLIDQKVEQIELRDINDRFMRLFECRMLDKASTYLYKEHAYAKQLRRLLQIISDKTRAAQVSVQSVFGPVVQELDSENRSRRAELFKDCKDAMFAYSKTIAACFREASVVASNCHMPGQRLARKPPTPFPDHAATQASSQVVYYSERLHPLEYPNLVRLLILENARMEDELVCVRTFYWWKRLVSTNRSVATIQREQQEKDKITKDRFGITHRVLATPKMIEEARMLRESSELQYRILRGKCDQALAERDELVAFKVSTQKRIEELEERRATYELKFPPELDVDAVARRLDALPPLEEVQVGPASPKASRFADKRNLQTALRQAAVAKALVFQQIDAFREVGSLQSPTAAALQDCERNLESCLENVRQTNSELDGMIVSHSFSGSTRASPSKSPFSSSAKSPLKSISRVFSDLPVQRLSPVKLSPLGADRYSQECDESTIASLQAQVDAFFAGITSQSVRAALEPEVQLFCRALYHGFTTAAGRVTIGEEYADIFPVVLQNVPQGSENSASVARLLNGWPRLLAVVLRAACPWLQARWVFIESKLAVALRQPRGRVALRLVLRFALRLGAVVKLCSSALSQVHILFFYLLGEYFLLSNRMLGIRYVKRTPRHLSFPLFPLRIVGILQLLRLVIIAAKHLARAIAQRRAAAYSSSVQFTNGVSLAAAAASAAAEPDADDAEGAVGDAPACPLCLSSRKQAACTPCGHVFCWRCIAEWLVKKPECPLCRCVRLRCDDCDRKTFNLPQEFVRTK